MGKISVSLSLEENLVARIDAIAEAEAVRRSWIVQKVLTGWCDQRGMQQPLEPLRPGLKAAGVGRRPTPRKAAEVSP